VLQIFQFEFYFQDYEGSLHVQVVR